MIFVACDKGNDEPNNGGNGNEPGTENPDDPNEPGDESEYYLTLDQETLAINPAGGSVKVVIKTNGEWTLSASSGSSWCTPSIKKGEANEEGQEVTFTAEGTDTAREATYTFKCKKDSKVSKKLKITQAQNDVIIADENNTFDVPVEGGSVEITYQTNVECKVVIPENAKSWISMSEATKALTTKSATLTVAENTTYADREAVVKVVSANNDELFAEYTIKQVENKGIVADEKNLTIEAAPAGGNVELIYKANTECKVIIPVAAEGWVKLPEATKALTEGKTVLVISKNRSGEARTAKVQIAMADNSGVSVEYTINQESEEVDAHYMYYKTSSKEIIAIEESDFGGSEILNNTYTGEIGTISINGPITTISEEAFKDCTALVEIEIPNTVTTIGDSAFAGCTNLEVYCESETPAALGATVFDATAKIYVPNALLTVYKEAEGWKDYAAQIFGYFGVGMEKPEKE